MYSNPERSGIRPEDLSEVELKNAWVVRHEGLLIASGWYIDVDQFTQDIVAAVVDLFRTDGLEGIIAAVTNDLSCILGGVAASAVSYSTSGAVEGEWSVFIADRSGKWVTTTPGLSTANLIRNLPEAGAVATLPRCSTTIAWSSQVRGVW